MIPAIFSLFHPPPVTPGFIAFPLLLCAAALALLPDQCPAAAYYLDASSGHDAASGRSPALAWQSLGKVNATTFQPGDQILLKAGSTWTGCLHPQGSGTASAKITLDRYDSGTKPVIHGGGVAGGAVFLENQQYWSINNLDVTNNGSAAPKKMGILIRNDCVGTLSGIAVRNCDIHDVAGVMTNYIDGKNANPPMFEQGASSNRSDILFRNNIFINIGSGSFNAPGGCTFDGNLYSGNYHIAADARKILANPLLVAAGSAGIGPASVDGYKLRSGSPALSAGTSVLNNGGLDFWGNPVPSSSPPHLGAYNGSAVLVTTITSGPIPLINPSLEAGGSGWEGPDNSVGFTGWTCAGPAGGATVAHAGSRGLWNCWGYGWNSLSQQSTYTVGVAGETITASVWAKTSDILIGGAWFNLTLTLDNVGVAFAQPNYPANQDWTKLTTAYVTTAADIGKTVGISFGTDGGTTNGQPNYVYMDDPGLSVVFPILTP